MNQLQMINRMLWGGGLDPDAKAFLDATAITDGTITTAINQFVIDLKAYNIWTKFKAIYPFVGGTATTHKFNLKDPRDLDVAFRLSFSGGLTHSSTGVLPNGSTGYANTSLIPSIQYSQTGNLSLGYYSRTNSSLANSSSMGVLDYANGSNVRIVIRRTGDVGLSMFNNSTSIDYKTYSINNSLGFFIGNVLNDIISMFKNEIKLTEVTSVSYGVDALPSLQIRLFSSHVGGNLYQYENKECALSSIGDGLTDSEVTDFNTAVNAFQTTLGRAV